LSMIRLDKPSFAILSTISIKTLNFKILSHQEMMTRIPLTLRAF